MEKISDIVKKHQGNDSFIPEQQKDKPLNNKHQGDDSFATLKIEERVRQEEAKVEVYMFRVEKYNEKCSTGWLSVMAKRNLELFPELEGFDTDVKVYIPARYVLNQRVNSQGVHAVSLPPSLVHKWLKDRKDYLAARKG